MTAALRVVLLVPVVLLVLALGAGSALSPPPAAAGGVRGGLAGDGFLDGALYNLTPYTMHFVSANAPDLGGGGDINRCRQAPSCWGDGGVLPGGWGFGDIKPGAYQVYGLNSWQAGSNCAVSTGIAAYYSAYITYRVDVIGGPPEYLTLAYVDHYNSDWCDKQFLPWRWVFNTTAPPPPNWDPNAHPDRPPGGGYSFAPATTNPQITFTADQPQQLDLTFGVAGNWSVDARTPLGSQFDDLLNSICGVGDSTSLPPGCSFTQTGPLTWGIGAPTAGGEQVNCQPVGGTQSWLDVEYESAQSATLSVGGSATFSTELNLFNVMKTKISIEIEAEHEWEKTTSFSRNARIYVPPRSVGLLWTAPTIGTVTGTLGLNFGTATFTVTNFSQTRSGVTKDNLTPAYATITTVREATDEELEGCPSAGSSRVAGAKVTGSANAEGKPALFPGRGVARVRLGQPQDARRLGRPLIKSAKANNSATANDCRVLDPHCRIVPGRGGTWVYDDLAVVFGADRRVSALFYSGRARSAEGVGVGSSLRAVRAAYPRASCVRSLRQANCTLKSTYRSRPVQTVFHFIEKKGRLECDRVLVYNVDERHEEVGA